MKKIFLFVKLELQYIKLNSFHLVILTLIFFCVLGYYGSLYGRTLQTFRQNPLSMRGELVSLNGEETFKQLNQIDSMRGYYVINRILPEVYVEFDGITIGCVSNNYPFKSDFKGRTFSYVENNSKELLLIIPFDFAQRHHLQIGQKIQFINRQYQIIGISGYSFLDHTFLVTQYEYRNHFQNKENYFNLVLSDNISDYEYAQALEKGSKLSNDTFRYSDFDKESRGYLNQFRVYTMIVFVISIINMVFVYFYILENKKKSYLIYKMHGANHFEIIGFILGDIILVYLLAFVLSIILLKVTSVYFLSRWFPSMPFVMNFKDVMMFFIFMLIIYVFIIVLMYRKQSKQSLIEVSKEKKSL